MRVKIMDIFHPDSWGMVCDVVVDNVPDPKNPDIIYHLVEGKSPNYEENIVTLLVDVTNTFEVWEPYGRDNGAIILMEV